MLHNKARTATSSKSSYSKRKDTKRKDTRAAKRLFRKLLCSKTAVSIETTTGKLRSCAAAKRDVTPSVAHCHDQYASNRAEVSHEPAREQERQMHGFRSDGHAQLFLSDHGQLNNLFRVARQLLRAHNYRELRSGAFDTWSQVKVCSMNADATSGRLAWRGIAQAR